MRLSDSIVFADALPIICPAILASPETSSFAVGEEFPMPTFPESRLYIEHVALITPDVLYLGT